MTTRHTVWSLIIGGYFTWISVYGINQTQVQRYLSVKKISQVHKYVDTFKNTFFLGNIRFFFYRAVWWNILGIGSLLLMCSYAGLVIFAFYDIHGCDPVKIKVIKVIKMYLTLYLTSFHCRM